MALTDNIREEFVKHCLEDRVLLINGPIEDSIVEDTIMQIIHWNKEDTIEEVDSKTYNRKDFPIKLYINSNGGSATECFSLINAMQSSKTPVLTFALGKVYSAGFLIFIAGHLRFAQKYSSMMYHQTSYIRGGEQQYHEEMLEYDKHVQKVAEDIVMQHTKFPKKKLDEIKKSKQDFYFLASQEEDLYRSKYKVFDFYY
jgi:ATP-dependent Clp protease protease subunit